LVDLVLRSLRSAAPRGGTAQDAAARHDLMRMQAMSPAQRLARLNEILRMTDICGRSEVSRELVFGRDFRL